MLSALQDLPKVHIATDTEVLHFVNRHSLFGLGIGYIDAHLLSAARLTPAAALWTFDKRLSATALRLGLAAGVA